MGKITDNSNELSFHQLTSTSSMLLVPLFQRPYVWTQKQLDRMISEIESIADKKDNSRFLGAVIAVTRPTNPSQPTPHEIVDGQQRLTTLYLFLLAASQIAAREGQTEYARGLISTNLIVDWAQELVSNTKLQPSIGDRGQFRKIFEKVWNTGELSDWLRIKVRLPQLAGQETGALLRQYNRIQKYFRKKVETNGFEAIAEIVEVVRNSLTFVFILLKDPGSATTVFEGLNDPGVPISVGDLVKNEIFARIGYDEPKAKLLHDHRWVPFREKFGDSFDEYFFPYCVIFKSSTNRTEMFGELRKLWNDLDAEEIVGRLQEYAKPFLALKGNQQLIDSYGREVGEQLRRLIQLKQPSSTYPFIMRLLKEFKDNKVGKKDVIGCLETLESFLVRRAICGVEPTGLLGMFRTMWSSADGHPTAKKVEAIILKRLTVEWPSDRRLRESIESRPIYGSTIASYVILKYDRAQGLDHPTITNFSIEHIMPRSYCDSWSNIVTRTQHTKLKDLWANLVPLTKTMNDAVKQSEFAFKKEVFAKESMFRSARQIGESYTTWGEKEIITRSSTLSDWAIERWKRPSGADN